MEKLTLFYLESCPYCRNALTALAALRREEPRYAAVGIDLIEESRQPEVAERYDYYRVPTIYAGDKKLYEAKVFDSYDVIKSNLQAALESVLKGRIPVSGFQGLDRT